MPIYVTARFRVKPESLVICKQAIAEFVAYVKANEPGTQLYASYHEVEDAAEFLHYFIFDDTAAEERHKASEGVKHFTSVLYPELASDGVAFTRYTLFATTD